MARAVLAINGGAPAVALPAPDYPGWSEQQVDALRRAALRGRSNLDWVSSSTPGGPVADFESAFEELVGGGYALAVNSGTSALETALLSVGVCAGDEVAVAAYNWSQCATAIAAVGAIPRWVDVVAGDATISPDSLGALRGSRPRAVVVTHLFGLPANMQALMGIARKADLAIVEDCAQALPARYAGLRVGTLGDAAAFSFGARKHLCCGEGGIVYSRRRDVYERGVLYTQHPDRQSHDRHGSLAGHFPCMALRSLRMHPLAAAAGLAGLLDLHERCEVQAGNHVWFGSQVQNLKLAQPTLTPPGRTNAWYIFPLLFSGARYGISRARYVAALRAEGVPISSHYIALPLSDEPLLRTEDDMDVALPEARAWCEDRGLFLQSGTAWGAVNRDYLRQLADAFVKVDELLVP